MHSIETIDAKLEELRTDDPKLTQYITVRPTSSLN
jgi:hypothetical protein